MARERGVTRSKASWRKGTFLHPYCHLVINGTRHDSPPQLFEGQSLSKSLLAARLKLGLTQETLAYRIKVSLSTFQNWERGQTKPNRRFWQAIRTLIGGWQFAANLEADRAFLALLSNCSHTASARWRGVKRAYRLHKPYPATQHRFGERLSKRRLDSGLIPMALGFRSHEVCTLFNLLKTFRQVKLFCSWQTLNALPLRLQGIGRREKFPTYYEDCLSRRHWNPLGQGCNSFVLEQVLLLVQRCRIKFEGGVIFSL